MNVEPDRSYDCLLCDWPVREVDGVLWHTDLGRITNMGCRAASRSAGEEEDIPRRWQAT